MSSTNLGRETEFPNPEIKGGFLASEKLPAEISVRAMSSYLGIPPPPTHPSKIELCDFGRAPWSKEVSPQFFYIYPNKAAEKVKAA